MLTQLREFIQKISRLFSPSLAIENERILELMHQYKLFECSLENLYYFHQSHYTRNLIFKNEFFEILILCWEPGQKTPIHDHEGQHCCMTVLRGTIESKNYVYVKSIDFKGDLTPLLQETYNRGDVSYIDDEIGIHQLENPAINNRRACTLHVYYKPIVGCLSYDLETKTAKKVSLVYNRIIGQRDTHRIAQEISFLV